MKKISFKKEVGLILLNTSQIQIHTPLKNLLIYNQENLMSTIWEFNMKAQIKITKLVTKFNNHNQSSSHLEQQKCHKEASKIHLKNYLMVK